MWANGFVVCPRGLVSALPADSFNRRVGTGCPNLPIHLRSCSNTCWLNENTNGLIRQGQRFTLSPFCSCCRSTVTTGIWNAGVTPLIPIPDRNAANFYPKPFGLSQVSPAYAWQDVSRKNRMYPKAQTPPSLPLSGEVRLWLSP